MRLYVRDNHLVYLLYLLRRLDVQRLPHRIAHLRGLHQLRVARMLPVGRVGLGVGHMVLLGQDIRIDAHHKSVILQLRRPLRLDVRIGDHELLDIDNVEGLSHGLVQFHLVEVGPVRGSVPKCQEAVLLELLEERLRRPHPRVDPEIPQEVRIP